MLSFDEKSFHLKYFKFVDRYPHDLRRKICKLANQRRESEETANQRPFRAATADFVKSWKFELANLRLKAK